MIHLCICVCVWIYMDIQHIYTHIRMPNVLGFVQVLVFAFGVISSPTLILVYPRRSSPYSHVSALSHTHTHIYVHTHILTYTHIHIH